MTVTTTLENSESSLLLLLRDLGLLHHQPQRPLACRAFLGCLQSIGTLGAMSLDGLTNATALSASLSSTCVFPPHAAARRAAVCEPLFPCHPSLMFCCLIPWCMHTMHSTHTHTHTIRSRTCCGRRAGRADHTHARLRMRSRILTHHALTHAPPHRPSLFVLLNCTRAGPP